LNPVTLSLSKGGRSWFDTLTTTGLGFNLICKAEQTGRVREDCDAGSESSSFAYFMETLAGRGELVERSTELVAGHDRVALRQAQGDRIHRRVSFRCLCKAQ
jgi:hypothetical protein